MSDGGGSGRGPYRGAQRHDGKPNHVKRLNFGRSILELAVLEQREQSVAASLNRGAVVIDQNVAGIPCTGKKDYVCKWIEAHQDEGMRRESSSGSSQSSPVLGTSTTDAVCTKSPIIGNSGKRFRGQTRVNRRADNADNEDRQERSAKHTVNCTVQRKLDCGSTENKNKQERLSEIQCTPPCIEKIVDNESPILGTHSNSRKRMRRKLLYGSEENISAKRLMLHKDTFTNMHIDTISNIGSDNVREDIFPVKEEKSLERSESYIFLSQVQEEPSSNNGSNNNNKEPANIEVDTSCDSEDEDCNESLSTNSSSNDNPSNIIEEVDTQDMIAEISRTSAIPLLIPGPSKFSQPITNASDETYCSEAEMMLSHSTRLSAKISQVPSGALSKNTQDAENKSTQTPVISTITTPSKTSLDKTVRAHLLDSGKKRRKPKKGSMVAKLQFLINAQMSSIRIWRHRMNKKHDTAFMQFISVFVHDCLERFGNQFLHGILIEDRFNLLQSNIEIEEAESCEVQAPLKETTYRDITVILVCDIVGTLKMISQVVINVYPPWEILDEDDLTIEPTYISINHKREIPGDLMSRNNPCKNEKRIIKEFNCPCIEEGRELPSCARKPNADKPDVMQMIFGA